MGYLEELKLPRNPTGFAIARKANGEARKHAVAHAVRRSINANLVPLCTWKKGGGDDTFNAEPFHAPTMRDASAHTTKFCAECNASFIASSRQEAAELFSA